MGNLSTNLQFDCIHTHYKPLVKKYNYMNTSLKKKTLEPIFHGHENRDFHDIF